MTDTKLLNFIRQEMKRQGVVWKKEQELFEMLVPNEPWVKYKTNWSNWKHEKVDELSKSPHIRLAIGQTLFFSSNVWGASDLVQKEAVVQGVERRFVKQSHLVPDLGAIIPSFVLDAEQEKLLETLETKNLEEIEKALANYPHYFERTFANQDFLVKLLDVLYAKGAYDFLVERLFPNLLSHQRGKVEVKVMEAHALGSLSEPRYMESVKLLESIKTNSDKKLIDLKTAMVSNLRRHHRANSNFSNEELKNGLVVMVETYHNIFEYQEAYHYYPAVNLMYALVLAEALALETIAIDKERVFKRAKKSIEAEKKSESSDEVYYASMSELEFMVLLKSPRVVKKMEMMLEELKPTLSLLERSKRQMVEFLNMTERLSADLATIKMEFKKLIGLLDDYEIGMKNEQ